MKVLNLHPDALSVSQGRKRSNGWIQPGRDPQIIAQLDWSCFDRPWQEESVRQLLQRPWFRAWTWHAQANSPALGYLLVEDQPDLLSILRVGVTPAHQRQGIGKELLHFLVRLARNEGSPGILLEVHEENLPAQTLYFQLGFRQIHCKRGYYADPPGNALVLLLDLP